MILTSPIHFVNTPRLSARTHKITGTIIAMNAVPIYSVLEEGDSQKPLNMQYTFTGNISAITYDLVT